MVDSRLSLWPQNTFSEFDHIQQGLLKALMIHHRRPRDNLGQVHEVVSTGLQISIMNPKTNLLHSYFMIRNLPWRRRMASLSPKCIWTRWKTAESLWSSCIRQHNSKRLYPAFSYQCGLAVQVEHSKSDHSSQSLQDQHMVLQNATKCKKS